MAKARSIMDDRIVLGERTFVELVVWEVPIPLRGSTHQYKYRLALVSKDDCQLRYDNEAGKGDHKHIGSTETPYQFQSLAQLENDFWEDVERWLKTQSEQ